MKPCSNSMWVSWFEHRFGLIWQWLQTAMCIGIYARMPSQYHHTNASTCKYGNLFVYNSSQKCYHLWIIWYLVINNSSQNFFSSVWTERGYETMLIFFSSNFLFLNIIILFPMSLTFLWDKLKLLHYLCVCMGFWNLYHIDKLSDSGPLHRARIMIDYCQKD